jgi:phage-related baseplate assembly protein
VTISIGSLFDVATAARVLELGLEIASAVGLPVTTWQAGDPTRTLYKYAAEVLSAKDSTVVEWIKAGFLSTATGDWLELLALEVYGVTKTQATFAEPTITLTNGGGGFYEIGVGELTVRNSVTEKTYHNTVAFSLSPGATEEDIALVADEAGSDSSVAANELDELVTTFLGVEIVSSEVGLANDAESDEALKQRCRDSLGALSPNGPADAYRFVALNSELTGLTSINRAEAVPSTNGTVTITIATVDGPADPSAVLAVAAAIEEWATPLCVNPVVVSADTLDVTLDLTIYKKASLGVTGQEFYDAIEASILRLFADTPIGGRGGEIAESEITNAVHETFPGQIYRVEGATDLTLATDEVPVLSSLTVTEQ